jgi:hypothetical protein
MHVSEAVAYGARAMNLRQRLRLTKISCIPWRSWRGEIDYLPISAKTLFARRGLPIDTWEDALKTEGYLFPDETLLEVLKTLANLKRIPFGTEEYTEPEDIGNFPDDWTEEDYIYFYEKRTV